MGDYIRTVAEVRADGKWHKNEGAVFPNPHEGMGRDPRPLIESPFTKQNYPAFALFANVRNRFGIEPISEPRGFPEDADTSSVGQLVPGIFSEPDSFYDVPLPPRTIAELVKVHGGWYFGYSWLSAAELAAVDYDRTLVDQDDIGRPVATTYRESLGDDYFEQLRALLSLGEPEDVRILFCFS